MLRTNLYKILQIAASPIWSPHNTCLWTVVLEKTPESPLDSKETKPVNPKGNQPWILTGRTDAETAILWPPNVKSQLTGKDPDAGKDYGQQEKGVTVDETVGWHYRLGKTWVWANSRIVKDRQDWCAAVHGVAESDMMSDWPSGIT